MANVPRGLEDLVRRLHPGAAVEGVVALGPDTGADDTEKVEGYGTPLRVTLREEDGSPLVLVFRTATSNVFGHDRRSDRAASLLLCFDTFPLVPRHVRALDVGAILPDGGLLSLGRGGEFYLLTTYAPGRTYAEDLRRVASTGIATPGDVDRCEALANHLVALHRARIPDPDGYRRAVRDLVGSGEGIYGMVDAYGPGVPAAPPERIRAIEESCAGWRWRLRGREERLARIHGDFHPFNVVFEEHGAGFTLLDASRGCRGDPADDATALAVNYLFFASDAPRAWRHGFGVLWHRFWDVYLRGSGDAAVLEVAPPWLAWRSLVVASPRFYPHLPASARDLLLGLAERALAAGRLDPAWADEVLP